ncbi:hypothetical protein Fmac_033063 [Flemingia macrophylla]|uniref:Secreted protein n=1 Tax=Flemingia macrophylla TaxID=520843 RepID=A0ABD1L6P1_9FABA
MRMLGLIMALISARLIISFHYRYLFRPPSDNAGLLLLFDKGPHLRSWRYLQSTQVNSDEKVVAVSLSFLTEGATKTYISPQISFQQAR